MHMKDHCLVIYKCSGNQIVCVCVCVLQMFAALPKVWHWIRGTSSSLTEGQKEAKIKETLKSSAEQTVMNTMERRGPTRVGVE